MLRLLIFVSVLVCTSLALDSSYARDRRAGLAQQQVQIGRAGDVSRLIRRESSSSPATSEAAEWDNTIWCYYDYKNGPSPFVKLNMDTWRHHAPKMKIVMVNDSNIKELIPDLPDEYFMLPYASAKSDLLRAALLYHHGGIYMDTDFLVNGPVMEDFIGRLKENDIVTYSDDTGRPSGQCGKYFSSNFMAGRKHNLFSKTWWDNIKLKLTTPCPKGAFKEEKVCCHEVGETDGTKHKECHIPWAAMEHMKDPTDAQISDQKAFIEKSRAMAGSSLIEIEATGHLEQQDAAGTRSQLGVGTMISTLAPEFVDRLPAGLKLYCFQGDQTMTPHLNGEVYWQHWSGDETLEDTSKVQYRYDTRFNCSAEGVDLLCSKGNWGDSHRRIPNFFGRIAYHLFFSTTSKESLSRDDVFAKQWLVSDMYRRSLGLKPSPSKFMESALVEEDAAGESASKSVEEIVREDFEKSDTDRSHGLNEVEVTALLRKTAVRKSLDWKRFDSNHDSELSLDELEHLAWKTPAYFQELAEEDNSTTKLVEEEKKKHNAEETMERKTIWAFYEYDGKYPRSPSPFVTLNLETWKRNAPDMRIVLVNDTNVKQLIPDLPEEYFKLGYSSAKSDLLRAALIYHHGGLYMDTDFLLMQPLTDVMAKLDTHDIATYSDNGGVPSGSCAPERSSSNFMAGRKGNGFSKVWWNNIKEKLLYKCNAKEYRSDGKLCCHEEGETLELYKSRNCRVPWAALEHMKDPHQAPAALIQLSEESGKSVSEVNAEKLSFNSMFLRSALSPSLKLILELPKSVQLYCFSGDDNFVPHLNGEVFWQPWNHGTMATLENEGGFDKKVYEQRFRCRVINSGKDLECDTGTWGKDKRVMRNFFSRRAYHLFFSTTNKRADTKLEVINKDWLLSYMYRKALGIES
eukprot:TRINITY_DN121768_c0_g1_i1.p1 TRINITY_DN121768_c0_g1~~TRINITY_DN121768_c0_g1_i1.p1  ORF type:complete len:909 (+),score=198.56 TRINITY_DN121768_c0_g1_i1:50-2776(+)